MNSIKHKLHKDEVVLGQMVLEFFVPGIPRMLAACGVDFVIFDMEHGRCDISLVAEMIAFSRGAGVPAIVRVPDATAAPLSRVLDLGAAGVMVPRIESRDQLLDVISQLKYAPQGRRGVALGITHDDYKTHGPSYFARANANTIVIALIETAKAFERLDEIISVPGLDVAWMGHYDLTVSMGIPAEFDNPKFLEKMDALLNCCARHQVAAGFLAATPESSVHWIGRGFRAICMGTDIATFTERVRDFRSSVVDGCEIQSKLLNSRGRDKLTRAKRRAIQSSER